MGLFRIIGLTILLILSGCKKGYTQEESVPRADEIVQLFSVTETNRGKPVWKIAAKEAQEFEKRNIVKLLDVTLIFYDSTESVISTLKADSGSVFTRNNNLEASGNVRVKSTQGDLYTKHLYWDNKREKIWTSDTILYIKGNEKYYGVGLESDPDLHHIIIKEKFKGEGKTEEWK